MCESGHSGGEVSIDDRFVLSHHRDENGFLSEFSKRFGKNGFPPIEPAEINGPDEKNIHFKGVVIYG
jgi:hypothetical protein